MNKGVFLTFGLCCIYPLAFHFAVTYGVKFFTRYDWRNVPWSEILSEVNPFNRKNK